MLTLVLTLGLAALAAPVQQAAPAAHAAYPIRYDGEVHRVDLVAQTSNLALSQPSTILNAMARDGRGELWIVGRDNATALPLQTQFFRFDPATESIVEVVALDALPDLRGVAFDDRGFAWAIYDAGVSATDPDELVRIDLAGRTWSSVGVLPIPNIQGLAWFRGGLVGVTVPGRVVAIDTATAQLAGTLAETGVGSQWACTDNCGRLWIGAQDAWWVNFDPPASLLPAPVFGFATGVQDVRGLEFAPVAGAAAVVAGEPPNPLVLSTPDASQAALGKQLALSIDHTTFVPGSVLDLALVGTATAAVVGPEGTLLLAPGSIALIPFAQVGSTTIQMPPNCAQFGLKLRVQGASRGPNGNFKLTNALDLTLGALGTL